MFYCLLDLTEYLGTDGLSQEDSPANFRAGVSWGMVFRESSQWVRGLGVVFC